MDLIEQFSTGLADRLAAAAKFTVGIHTGKRPTSGILWRPDVVVASEQLLPDDAILKVVHAGQTIDATLAGRDPSTNVAVLKLATALAGALPAAAEAPRVGNLTLLAGADAQGNVTGRLAMVHALGEAWHSMAGGRIDALIQLQTGLGIDEGGPVLSLGGSLIGMSTSGPRRRTIVIPTATLERVVAPLLADGRIARGWLGIGLQPVIVPDTFRQTTARESGLMVVALASGGPSEAAGVLPGDIVLDIDGTPAGRRRALSASLGPDRIGQAVELRVLRAGAVQTISVTIAAGRPHETGDMSTSLRIRVHTTDPVRRRGLAAMLEAAGHVLTDETPDVEVCDLDRSSTPLPKEAEAPVVALTKTPPAGAPAGVLTPDATAEQLDAALRAVVAGLLVRSAAAPETRGFAPAEDMPLLTPREREILALIGEGLSNKAMARRLGISVHTVKFHLEALFTKLDATSRAEAVAKGLRGGVIEL